MPVAWGKEKANDIGTVDCYLPSGIAPISGSECVCVCWSGKGQRVVSRLTPLNPDVSLLARLWARWSAMMNVLWKTINSVA